MSTQNWKKALEHPPSDPNCSNGTSITVTVWHPTLESDGWICQGYYHPRAKEWWSYGYGIFEGDDPFLRWSPLIDEPWEPPTDIDWDAVALKWRAGEVMQQAIQLLGGEDRAYDWAQTPLVSLEGQTPLAVLETDPERVAALLQKFQDG